MSDFDPVKDTQRYFENQGFDSETARRLMLCVLERALAFNEEFEQRFADAQQRIAADPTAVEEFDLAFSSAVMDQHLVKVAANQEILDKAEAIRDLTSGNLRQLMEMSK